MQGEPTQQTIGRGYSSAREYGSAGGRPTRYSVEDMASGLGLRDAEYDDKTTRTVENMWLERHITRRRLEIASCTLTGMLRL